jgi:ribonuclease HI
MAATTILHWNARGIRAHTEELKKYIIDNDTPDVICLQETFLKPTHAFSFNGYSIERKDRLDSDKGGLAVLVKHGISYAILPCTDKIECQSIKISTKQQEITICNVYNPPNTVIEKEEYKTLFSNKNCFIVGDFNSFSTLWGSPKEDKNGQILQELLDEFHAVVLNDGRGTYMKNLGGVSHLDLSFASPNLAIKCNWSVLETSLGSDHFPVVIKYNAPPVIEDNSNIKWGLRRANWEKFKSCCKSIVNKDVVKANTSDYCKALTEAIVRAAEQSIPIISVKPSRPKTVPYWDSDCDSAVNERNRAQSEANKKGAKSQAAMEYRRLRGVAQRVIKDAKANYWRTYCDTLTGSTKMGSVWRMAKKMTGNNSCSTIPTLTKDNKDHCSNIEKANLLAQTFANTSNNSNLSESFKRHRAKMEIQYALQHPQCNDGEAINQAFEFHELATAIRQSKNNSSPGKDRIVYEMLKHLPKPCVELLLDFYNKCWAEGTIAPEWKETIVIPVRKPNKTASDPQSYRPITLSSILCKILERLVTNRLSWYLETNKLLNESQCGFRKNRSTTDQLVRLHDAINKALATGGYLVGVFLDFKAAFDLVWREGLLFKLRGLGIGGNMHRWINDFLTGRTIKVKVGGEISDPQTLDNGTPQGSVISPLLFLIMINDIPTVNNAQSQTSIYADDGSLWRSGVNLKQLNKDLQKQLDDVVAWCDCWGFKISEAKTVGVVFTRKKQQNIKIKIHGNEISIENEVKFLGMIFDSKLTWNAHINSLVAKCVSRINLMRSVTSHSWGASKSVLLTIYRALVRSRLDYGSQLLYTASKTALAKLDTIQATCLRICSGAMRGTAISAMQQDCGEMPLSLRRHELQLRLAVKLSCSENNPASSVLEDNWQNHWGNYKSGTEPLYNITKSYLDTLNLKQIEGPSCSKNEPWLCTPAMVNLSLADKVKKSDNPEFIRLHARELMQEYTTMTHIYTDGSKTTDDKVGSAFCVPSLGVEHAIRINDNSTVYTAELIAIKHALCWIKDAPVNRFVIFSDSLSALQSLDTGRCVSRPNTVQQIKELLNEVTKRSVVVIAWIPSHVGIAGNEHADLLAKSATEKLTIDVDVPQEIKDAYNDVSKYICSLWQKQYDESNTGAQYRLLEPKISKKIKYSNKQRDKEVTMTRLRLGKCCLNYYLHKIGCHDNGLCDTCGEPETIEHLLLLCTQYNIGDDIKLRCKRLNIEPTVVNILKNSKLIDLTYSLLSQHGIRL